MAGGNCRNHNYIVKEVLCQLGLTDFADINNTAINLRTFQLKTQEALMNKHVHEWKAQINSESGRSGKGRNKLRTYKLFKTEYKTEDYCKIFLPIKHRSAFSKFRCGVAPIRIETGRFVNLEVSQRLCPFCDCVEDEVHVILKCSTYNNLRNILVSKANALLPAFNTLSDDGKMNFLFSHPNMIRLCAKTCFKILQIRNSLLYK